MLGWCVDGLDLGLSPLASLWWWLVLLIEAQVLSSNIEREGSQQRPIQKGTASTSYPDKRWPSPAKGSGGDAVLGSMVTFVLLSFWSWSRCTNMETFS